MNATFRAKERHTSAPYTLAFAILSVAASLFVAPDVHAFERTQTCFPGLPVSELGCREGEEPRPIYWDQACISWRLNEEIDPAKFDARKVAGDPSQSIGLTPVDDQAGIKRRAKMAMAYLVRGEDGKVQSIVLPIYGKGLWSTLYGFVALEGDAKTVRGITYYEHGETPGLGGEVDNPAWKAQWPGKVIVDDQGEPILNVTKPGNARAENEVDGLSGATITSTGVENMIQYWLGDNAFGPFLERYREGKLAIRQSK